MKNSRRIVPVLAVILALGSSTAVVGCGKPAEAPVVAKEMPPGETWNGVYFHPIFGRLHMVEQGSNIVGRWLRTDKSKWGELNGTIDGNVVRFNWKEHTYGAVGQYGTSSGKGYFVYKVPSSGIPELDGKYGIGNDEPTSDWHCVKQMNEKPDLDSIKGEVGGSEIPAAQDKWK